MGTRSILSLLPTAIILFLSRYPPMYAFSSAITLILIVTILIFNTLVNKLTGASLDDGIGGN